jgi:hypothetical protein
MWVWDPDRVKGDFITPNLFVVAYLSQLVIADVDDWEKFSGLGLELPPTLTAVSGSGRGLHLYYKKPWGMRGPVPRLVRSTLPEGTGEVRWTGVVAAPPSAHKSGSRYAWANPGAAVADAPSWLGAVKTTNAVRPPLLRTGEVDDVWAMRMREAWIADARGLAHLADLGDGRRQRPVKSFAAAARGGQLVHWGILNAEGAMRILFDAATSNGWVEDAGADEVLRQIRNGLETGRLDALEGPMTEEDLDDE